LLGIAVLSPNGFKKILAVFQCRFGIERVTIAIAAAIEDHLTLTDPPFRGTAPLAMEDRLSYLGVVFGSKLSSVLFSAIKLGAFGAGMLLCVSPCRCSIRRITNLPR
jgi:hypothetical protein